MTIYSLDRPARRSDTSRRSSIDSCRLLSWVVIPPSCSTPNGPGPGLCGVCREARRPTVLSSRGTARTGVGSMTSRPDRDANRALPYTARELSTKEVRDEDIYTFNSPKMGGRRTRVAMLPNLILALQLEFDPEVESYIERPRQLACDSETYEFSFWYRLKSGREFLPLLVSTGSTEPGASASRRHRKERQTP